MCGFSCVVGLSGKWTRVMFGQMTFRGYKTFHCKLCLNCILRVERCSEFRFAVLKYLHPGTLASIAAEVRFPHAVRFEDYAEVLFAVLVDVSRASGDYLLAVDIQLRLQVVLYSEFLNHAFLALGAFGGCNRTLKRYRSRVG